MRPLFRKPNLANLARFRGSLASGGSYIWIAISLSLAVLASFAQQNPPSRGRDVIKLYTQYCASCHGTNMAGGSASSLVDGVWRYGGGDASIAASIRDGHPGEGM